MPDAETETTVVGPAAADAAFAVVVAAAIGAATTLDGRSRGRLGRGRPAQELRQLEREHRREDETPDEDEDLLLALSRRARVGRHGVLPAAVAPVEELSLSVVRGGGATGTIGPS